MNGGLTLRLAREGSIKNLTMAVLLETDVGDMVIDLDVEGSPELSRNLLKLCKARYYTKTLIYNVNSRFCQAGDPIGDGTGGGCMYGLLDQHSSSPLADIRQSQRRFLKGKGRKLSASECREKGRVVATELNGVPDTIGSQFLITLESGEGRALDGYVRSSIVSDEASKESGKSVSSFLSLGTVTEDVDGALDKIAASYCDPDGRPYADIRIIRALVIHDPFDDPEGMDELLAKRDVVVHAESGRVTSSPSPERPVEEAVAVRIPISQIEPDEEGLTEVELRRREEQAQKQEDRGRAVVLEMLGDLPDADIKAPENVLFICKLNPITQDEDLELIFSRFDPTVKVEIIRDQSTGKSLQYAFAEFEEKQQAVEAYFKMNNALVDDRRIKVDFSQSVSKIWNKYTQKMRMPTGGPGGTFQNSASTGPGVSRGRGGRHSCQGGNWQVRNDDRHRPSERSVMRSYYGSPNRSNDDRHRDSRRSADARKMDWQRDHRDKRERQRSDDPSSHSKGDRNGSRHRGRAGDGDRRKRDERTHEDRENDRERHYHTERDAGRIDDGRSHSVRREYDRVERKRKDRTGYDDNYHRRSKSSHRHRDEGHKERRRDKERSYSGEDSHRKSEHRDRDHERSRRDSKRKRRSRS